MKKTLVHHIVEMLRLSKQIVTSQPLRIKETGVVNVKGERSIAMDVVVEKLFIDYVQKNKLPVAIFSEEAGTISFDNNPKFLLAFDPLDGSTNYKIGKNLLPFGTLITFYDGLKPKIDNILAAGAIEYTKDLAWITDGRVTTDLSGNRVTLKTGWPIDKSTPVYLDLYYREGYKTYLSLAQKIFIRNTGSTIGNLSCTLSGVAAGLGGVCMRAEEIGAVYTLIKGAGGIAVNHQGKDLGKENFHPEKTYPILAGNKLVVDFCVAQLKQYSK